MHYEWSFGFLLQYSKLIGVGTAYTIGFTILTAVAGFIVGCIVAIASLSNIRLISAPPAPREARCSSAAARPG